MLEVRNLTKIYKTKGGAEVRALDDVSVSFPETGMVFLLGKSGSGKSTLLNLCGGLDSPTSGEIIIKGRSSVFFSGSDFDSYRNTYVGFIFQEYNVLAEFSVEDNIALAIELQGKTCEKGMVENLLREVDLEGFAKRKPNTLSGGQKQRIAIARALIKSPEIIMADEPTGALDSSTGKQVFETLKKLSQKKLVLVVSHDREFAELYGDRIIELKDGKILSDVSKTTEEKKDFSENLSEFGEVLCVKNAKSLGAKEWEKIKEFFSSASGDVILASGEGEVKAFKQVSRIGEDGKEVFRNTKADSIKKKSYSKEESRFIKSSLPMRHAVKMGLSSVKNKPLRLFFTILLCTIAFIMFGVSSTLTFYNSESIFKQSIIDNEIDMMQLRKQYPVEVIHYSGGEENGRYTYYNETVFSSDELSSFKENFGEDAFGGISMQFTFNVNSQASVYWTPSIKTIATLSENNSIRTRINGDYPVASDEMVISSYTADVIVNCKAYDKAGNMIDVQKREDLIGKKILIQNKEYKITGIFDSGVIPEKFEVLKTSAEEKRLIADFTTTLEDGLHLVAFVSEEQISEIYSMYISGNYFKGSWEKAITIPHKNGDEEVYDEWSNAYYGLFGEANKENSVMLTGKTEPSSGEAVVSVSLFSDIGSEIIYKDIEAFNNAGQYSKAENLHKLVEKLSAISRGYIWEYDSITGEGTERKITSSEREAFISDVAGYLKSKNVSVKFKMFNTDSGSLYGSEQVFKVIGFDKTNDNYERMLYLSEEDEKAFWDEQKGKLAYYSEEIVKYNQPEGGIYNKIYLPFNGSEALSEEFWGYYSNKELSEDYSLTTLSGTFVENLKYVDEMVSLCTKIFFWVGVAFAVFAILLFSNFIATSISQKTKEIGILRAVGARGSDVFKIFFSESFFIAAICFGLSLTGSIILCSVINNLLSAGIGASLFVFGIPSFITLLAVALLTAVLSTFLPVRKAAKRKPVDSIRAL